MKIKRPLALLLALSISNIPQVLLPQGLNKFKYLIEDRIAMARPLFSPEKSGGSPTQTDAQEVNQTDAQKLINYLSRFDPVLKNLIFEYKDNYPLVTQKLKEIKQEITTYLSELQFPDVNPLRVLEIQGIAKSSLRKRLLPYANDKNISSEEKKLRKEVQLAEETERLKATIVPSSLRKEVLQKLKSTLDYLGDVRKSAKGTNTKYAKENAKILKEIEEMYGPLRLYLNEVKNQSSTTNDLKLIGKWADAKKSELSVFYQKLVNSDSNKLLKEENKITTAKGFEATFNFVFSSFNAKSMQKIEEFMTLIADKKAKNIPAVEEIKKMRKVFDDYGFKLGRIPNPNETEYDLLISQWNVAKGFMFLLEANIKSMGTTIDPFIITAGKISQENPKLEEIAANYTRLWFQRAGFDYFEHDEIYSIDETISLEAQLSSFKTSMDKKAQQGKETWTHLYAELDTRGLSSLEMQIYRGMKDLPYFTAIAFQNAFDAVKSNGVDDQLAWKLIAHSMIKLRFLGNATLEQSYLNHVVTHVSSLASYNPNNFRSALEKINSRIPRPDKSNVRNILARVSLGNLYLDAFEKISKIPTFASAVIGRNGLLERFVYEDSYTRNYSLKQPSCAKSWTEDQDRSRWWAPTTPFGSVRVNQMIGTLGIGGLTGFGSERTGNFTTASQPVLTMIPPETEAWGHFNQTWGFLYPTHPSLSIGGLIPGPSLLQQNYTDISRFIEAAFIADERPGYVWTPAQSGSAAFGASGRKSSADWNNTYVGYASYLSPTGGIGAAISESQWAGREESFISGGMRGVPIGTVDIHNLEIVREKAIRTGSLTTEETSWLAQAMLSTVGDQNYFMFYNRDRITGDETQKSTRLRMLRVDNEGTIYELDVSQDSLLGLYNFMAFRWIQDFDNVGVTLGITGSGPGLYDKMGIDTGFGYMKPEDITALKSSAAYQQLTKKYNDSLEAANTGFGDIESIDISTLQKQNESTQEEIKTKTDELETTRSLSDNERKNLEDEVEELKSQNSRNNYLIQKKLDFDKDLDKLKAPIIQDKIDKMWGLGGVIAFDLPGNVAIASMGTTVPGFTGERIFYETMGAVAKTFEKGKNYTSHIVAVTAAGGLHEDLTKYKIYTGEYTYRKVTLDDKGNAIEGIEVSPQFGGGTTAEGKPTYLGGLSVHYEKPGKMKVGGSVGYAEASAIYRDATLYGLEGYEKIKAEFDQLRHVYFNVYGGVKNQEWLIGAIGNFMVELKGKESNEFYYNTMFLLKYLKDEVGLKITSKRFPALFQVFQAKHLLAAVASGYQNPESVTSRTKQLMVDITRELNTVYENHYIGLKLTKNFSLEAYVLAADEKNQWLVSGGNIKELGWRLLGTWDSGFIRSTGRLPIGASGLAGSIFNETIGSSNSTLGFGSLGVGFDTGSQEVFKRIVLEGAVYFSHHQKSKDEITSTTSALIPTRIGIPRKINPSLNRSRILDDYLSAEEEPEYAFKGLGQTMSIHVYDTATSIMRKYKQLSAKLKKLMKDPARHQDEIRHLKEDLARLDEQAKTHVFMNFKSMQGFKDNKWTFEGFTAEALVAVIEKGAAYLMYDLDNRKLLLTANAEEAQKMRHTIYVGGTYAFDLGKGYNLDFDTVFGVGLEEKRFTGSLYVTLGTPWFIEGKRVKFSLGGSFVDTNVKDYYPAEKNSSYYDFKWGYPQWFVGFFVTIGDGKPQPLRSAPGSIPTYGSKGGQRGFDTTNPY